MAERAFTPAFIDEQLERVLRAAGSPLRHYMPASRDDLRKAMGVALYEAVKLAVCQDADRVDALYRARASANERGE